jgi:hypothetical protein
MLSVSSLFLFLFLSYREYMDLSKPRGDLTVLEASIVRAVLGDELCPSPAASLSVSSSASGQALSSTCSRDGEGIQGQSQIPSLSAERSATDASTASAADSSIRHGPDSSGKERNNSDSVTSALTCDDATVILHGTENHSITSVSACSIAAPIQLQSNIEYSFDKDKNNSVPKCDYTLALKRDKYRNGNYDEVRGLLEAKRCLGLLTPAACFAFVNSRKKRRRDADKEACLEEDEERAEECGSYVKIRPNVGATSKFPFGASDDLSYVDSDLYEKKRKFPSAALIGLDMDDMAATMGFSYFKNNYKS